MDIQPPLRPYFTHDSYNLLSIKDIKDVVVVKMIQPDIMAIPIQTTEMPIGEYLPVATSVASVANAYQEALELIREIRKRGHARGAVKCEASLDAAAEDLELSLVRGQEVIRSQYDRDYRRLGKHFAEGDGQSSPWSHGSFTNSP